MWAREAAIEQTALALDMGVRSLTFFENYFNISYPLPKQDMIALPDFISGAMENWGLITYRQADVVILFRINYSNLINLVNKIMWFVLDEIN